MLVCANLRIPRDVCTIVGMLRGTVVLAMVLTFVGACAGGATQETDGIKVVASFYPLAFVAEQIGGDDVSVANLTSAGTEPHELELTPKQLSAISEADLVIVMGNGFQPGVETAAKNGGATTLSILDLFDDPEAADPHVWLDPDKMRVIVDAIDSALGAVDAEKSESYHTEANRLKTELATLNADLESGLASCERRDLFTAHDSFAWFGLQYGLVAHGVAAVNPNSEPGPERLVELADLATASGATTIFAESLLSPEIAEALAQEVGNLQVAVLNPLEGLTESQVESGDDYFSIMNSNLMVLRDALDCV